MKNKLVYLLVVLLLVTIVGCAPNDEPQPDDNEQIGEENETPPEVNDPVDNPVYEDGTYEGVGDEWQHGNENATVIIQDGAITDITLRRLDTEGQEVNYDDWTGEEIDGRVYPNLRQYREDMANKIIDAQDPNVDAIAGATVSSENWKLAVERALEEAKIEE